MLPTRQSPLAQDHCDAPLVGAILGGPQVNGAIRAGIPHRAGKKNDPIAPYYLLQYNVYRGTVPARIQVSETTQHI